MRSTSNYNCEVNMNKVIWLKTKKLNSRIKMVSKEEYFKYKKQRRKELLKKLSIIIPIFSTLKLLSKRLDSFYSEMEYSYLLADTFEKPLLIIIWSLIIVVASRLIFLISMVCNGFMI